MYELDTHPNINLFFLYKNIILSQNNKRMNPYLSSFVPCKLAFETSQLEK